MHRIIQIKLDTDDLANANGTFIVSLSPPASLLRHRRDTAVRTVTYDNYRRIMTELFELPPKHADEFIARLAAFERSLWDYDSAANSNRTLAEIVQGTNSAGDVTTPSIVSLAMLKQITNSSVSRSCSQRRKTVQIDFEALFSSMSQRALKLTDSSMVKVIDAEYFAQLAAVMTTYDREFIQNYILLAIIPTLSGYLPIEYAKIIGRDLTLLDRQDYCIDMTQYYLDLPTQLIYVNHAYNDAVMNEVCFRNEMFVIIFRSTTSLRRCARH